MSHVIVIFRRPNARSLCRILNKCSFHQSVNSHRVILISCANSDVMIFTNHLQQPFLERCSLVS